MATFPAIAPIYPASKSSVLELSNLQLGDGYKARYNFGLNNTKFEWQLEWLVDQNSADAIDLFLQSCSDSAEFFQWRPPDSASELNWRCDEWSVEQQNYNLYSIKAVFKRAFDLSIIALTPQASTACYQEELCDTSDNFTVSSYEAGGFVIFGSKPRPCGSIVTKLRLDFVKEDGTVITELYNPYLLTVDKINWSIVGYDGTIDSSMGRFNSATANFQNNGSLINQYLVIEDPAKTYQTSTVAYRITNYISPTTLGIASITDPNDPLVTYTPLFPMTEGRKFFIGGATAIARPFNIDSTYVNIVEYAEGVEGSYDIQRFIGYDKIGLQPKTSSWCRFPFESGQLPSWDPDKPPFYGPWAPSGNGFIYTGDCELVNTCIQWNASGYGQTSFIQVCRNATVTSIGPAFWGGFGGIGDPSQTYKFPQFYYSFCDGYSWQIVNNGGAIYLPYAGAPLPEFHLTVVQS